ncbi:MAG: hypothetical protein AAFQ87_10525, partial [Bacteroidota bacterium]
MTPSRNSHGFAFAKLRILLLCLILTSGLVGRAQFALNGNATSLGNDCFRLTTTTNFQQGSIWYLNQVDISESFDLIFQVNLGCRDSDGADGIAFVLQQVSTSVGSAGGGLGYSGISPSIAVELDTWQNGGLNDPFTDHMAIIRNGNLDHLGPDNLAGPVNISATSGNVEDCMDHDFRVTWNADSSIMRVYFDCELRLSYTGNLIQSTFGNNSQVFWGFTGATGGFTNNQQFCLDFISFFEALEDTAICPNTSVQLDAGAGDTYAWLPTAGLSDPSIRNPIAQPGTYTVTVTDGCVERYDTVTVSVRPPLLDVLPDQLTLCRGDSLEINANTFEANYLWSDGSSDSILLVSQPGTYAVSIFAPCDTLIDSVTVVYPPDPQINVVDVACFGESNGSLQVSYNGPGPYLYEWLDDQGSLLNWLNTSSTQYNLNSQFAAGNYTLNILDNAGCLFDTTVTIQQPSLLVLQAVQVVDIPCGGTPSGSITLGSSGGTPPYQYALNGGAFQNSLAFNSLLAGSYQAVIRDANQCLDTINLNINENPPLLVQINSIDSVSCNGGNDGSVSLGANGGLGNTYLYSIDGTNFQSSPTFTGLIAGTYTAFVEDSIGCVSTQIFAIEEPDPLGFTVLVSNPIDCAGNANGNIVIQASGGTGPYQYSLQASPFSPDSSFLNLSAGTYSIAIEDANNCLLNGSYTLIEPDPLVLATDNVLMVDCYLNASGEVDLGASGGTQPYQYATLGQAFSPSDIAGGLPAGNYQFVVQDTNACLDTLSLTITQPDSLSVVVTQRLDVSCLGDANGQLDVQGIGGTMPYQFSINNGPLQNNGQFPGLFAGFYTLSITDGNGCPASVDTVITTPTGLAIGILDQQNIDCFGNNNGSLTFQAVGGTGPYRYSPDGVNFFPLSQAWDNLPPGADTLLAFDANDCLVPIPYLITEPAPINLQVDSLRTVDCFGDASGAIQITASGGTLPYQFQINGGPLQANSLFSNLLAGSYQIQLVDDSACTTSLDTIISQSAELILAADSVAMVDCWGNASGLIELSVQGGQMPYLIQENNGLFTNQLTYPGLIAGNYQYVVQDSLSCTDTLSIEISQPDSLISGIQQSVDILCFGDSTGSILLSTQGGTTPYIFQLGPASQNDSLFSNLPAGNYSITVLDQQGCSVLVEDSLTQPSLLEAEVELQDIRCFGEANGSIEVLGSGGVRPYQYQLGGSVPQSGNLIGPLSPGTYEITLTDDNGCSVLRSSLTLEEPDSLTVNLTGQDLTCYLAQNGQIRADIQGG